MYFWKVKLLLQEQDKTKGKKAVLLYSLGILFILEKVFTQYNIIKSPVPASKLIKSRQLAMLIVDIKINGKEGFCLKQFN